MPARARARNLAGFGHQRAGHFDRVLQVGELFAVAERVAAERDIAEFGQHLGAVLGVLSEAERFRHHEYARAFAGLLVVIRKKAFQGGAGVGVGEGLGMHRLLLWLIVRGYLSQLRISSLCWPSSGPGRRSCAGVREKRVTGPS